MERTDVVVIGLGFVGLRLATTFVQAGYQVCGVETDTARLEQLRDVGVRGLSLQGGRRLPEADVYCISVPTPAGPDGQIDLSYLRKACRAVAKAVRRGVLVLIHSTCSPGTIENQLIRGHFNHSTLCVGTDFHVAHAPERIDPGPAMPVTAPRIVAGYTGNCTNAALSFLRTVFDEVHAVRSIRTAEFVKTFENTFRLVNISLANELAAICLNHDVDPVEVIEAAATKPYGFLPHRPGIGAGGGCVPVVAEFFRATAHQQGTMAPVAEAALAVNTAMPGRTVEMLRTRAAEAYRLTLRRCRVLVVGVTYKPDVPDIRNSSAVRVIERLTTISASVTYFDPLVPRLRLDGGRILRSVTRLDRGGFDLAVILTKHSDVDHDGLLRCGLPVLDCSSGVPVAAAG